jgi:hypothetical protein
MLNEVTAFLQLSHGINERRAKVSFLQKLDFLRDHYCAVHQIDQLLKQFPSSDLDGDMIVSNIKRKRSRLDHWMHLTEEEMIEALNAISRVVLQY